jgi:hypothetical protein
MDSIGDCNVDLAVEKLAADLADEIVFLGVCHLSVEDCVALSDPS